MSELNFDIVIIGAGMAGASLAARCAGSGSILIAEAEDRPGYHTTGRSAAFWSESYGGPGVQPLTTASGMELEALGMLTLRRAVTMGKQGQEQRVEAFAAEYSALGVKVELLDRAGIEALVPGLRNNWVCGALETSCCDIDVAGLHQHYLAIARKGGAELRCRAALKSAMREDGRWRLSFSDGSEATCDILVNAAGAWADPVAEMAGAKAVGIAPLRRTMVQLIVEPAAPSDLPLVMDIDDEFYFKPESGRIWLSPHDEIPSPPCDAAPEELDVAIAIDRFESAVDWQIKRVEHRWAGLRSFAPDRLPVYGFDTKVPGFFWFAGQGGFGIQTAPAAAELAGRLLLGEAAGSIDPAPYDPVRFG